MLHLRPYQEEAKASVYDFLRTRPGNPCVVIPTGGGKTPVLASMCKDAVGLWAGRVLIIAHVKELLEQAAAKLRAVCPEVCFGMYSAGLKRRDTTEPVIVAGIQSVYKRACELDAFDLVLIDEAHLIPPEGDGMYRQFLADARIVNPDLRIVGFTATPFRMKTGPLCTPEGFLNQICFEVGVRELIRDGFLCPLVSKAGQARADTSRLHVQAGEFIAGEVEALMDEERLVEAACAEIIHHAQYRRACLIFAAGIQHGRHIVEVLSRLHGIECGFVCNETSDAGRRFQLDRFIRGELRFLANINVLTTGFDATHIDCIVLLRPTLSPGLYYQMVGRGFRIHPGKKDCLVLDFGGNVVRHGPVDRIKIVSRAPETGEAPAKECPNCQSLVAAGYARCPDCGYEFPQRQRRQHEARSSDEDIMSQEITTTRYPVHDVLYRVHTKRGVEENASRSMRVDYKIGWNKFKSEWICFEHTGYARQRANAWWRRRSSDSIPDTVQAAVDIANNGGLALTTAIVVRAIADDPFERIIDWELAPKPESLPEEELTNSLSETELSEIPF